MVGPLGGVGGLEDETKEKFVAVKNFNIFCLRRHDQNINISVLCCRLANSQYITGFLKYLPKNLALLVQELWRKKNCQNPFQMKKSSHDH